MKVGDLVKPIRYGTRYLIVGKREDLSFANSSGQAFVILSLDGSLKQTLNERLLEVISEGR